MKTISPQQRFLDHALPLVQQDGRFLGAAATGLAADGAFTLFSPLHLLLLLDPARGAASPEEARRIASSFGPLLSCFTVSGPAESLRLTTLYEEPLLEVTLHFLSPDELAARQENPAVLWERDGQCTKIIEHARPQPERLDLDWMEERFWVWLHAGASFLGQGEIFAVLNTLCELRSRILLPLATTRPGHGIARGKAEDLCDPETLACLKATIASDHRESAALALRAAARLYLELREKHASAALERNRRAEMAVLRHLHQASEKFSDRN